MTYIKNQGTQKPALGKLFSSEEFANTKLRTFTIKEFIKEFNINLTVVAIGYHMKKNKIDWGQPGTNRFIILSQVTKNFYNI